MKKTILTIATLCVTLAGIAQEKYIVSANVALKTGNLEEAKESIDKAIANPETSEKPKALFSKAQIYIMMNSSPKYKDSHPYREAAQALIKLADVKPDYEKADADQMLIVCGAYYYNDAITKYGNKNDSNRYNEAGPLFMNVVKIHDLNGGKRFDKFERKLSVDSIAARSAMYAAFCSYFSGKYDEAIPMLIKAKNDPITRETYVYADLIDAYEKTKNLDQELATIQEARAAYPTNEGLRNDELNYYIITGKQDELVKKLEAEAAKTPDNGDIQFTLGTVYSGLANPKTGSKPANRAELIAKSEAAFQKAVNAKPDDAEMNFDLGGMYNNDAKEVNDQINEITGNSQADMKKYNELKVKRDALFEKALPFVEKAYNILDPKAATLKAGERTAYYGSMRVLVQIYTIQNKMDKAEPLKQKLNAK